MLQYLPADLAIVWRQRPYHPLCRKYRALKLGYFDDISVKYDRISIHPARFLAIRGAFELVTALGSDGYEYVYNYNELLQGVQRKATRVHPCISMSLFLDTKQLSSKSEQD